jgi:hypothetical protein
MHEGDEKALAEDEVAGVGFALNVTDALGIPAGESPFDDREFAGCRRGPGQLLRGERRTQAIFDFLIWLERRNRDGPDAIDTTGSPIAEFKSKNKKRGPQRGA